MKENNSPQHLGERTKEEVDEMLAEMQWGTREPTPEEIEKVGAELADVVIFSLTLGETLGIDVESAIRTKVAKNEERFPAELFQDTTQSFDLVYMKRKVELGERPPSVLQPGVEVTLPKPPLDKGR